MTSSLLFNSEVRPMKESSAWTKGDSKVRHMYERHWQHLGNAQLDVGHDLFLVYGGEA